MKKNENGYPVIEKETQQCLNTPRVGTGGNADQNPNTPSDLLGNTETNTQRVRPKEGCSRSEGNIDSRTNLNDAGCDEVPLAYVYSPVQKFCMLYSDEEALKHGTLFENLYKPLGVYGRE